MLSCDNALYNDSTIYERLLYAWYEKIFCLIIKTVHDLWMNYVCMNKCKYPKCSWTWAEHMCRNLWLSKGVFESMIDLEHLNLWIYESENMRNLEPENFEN